MAHECQSKGPLRQKLGTRAEGNSFHNWSAVPADWRAAGLGVGGPKANAAGLQHTLLQELAEEPAEKFLPDQKEVQFQDSDEWFTPGMFWAKIRKAVQPFVWQLGSNCSERSNKEGLTTQT